MQSKHFEDLYQVRTRVIPWKPGITLISSLAIANFASSQVDTLANLPLMHTTITKLTESFTYVFLFIFQVG